jgi:ribosome-binding protein aMBF1 (putative translation factor)
MLTSEQVRAARALLSWSEERLADEAHLSTETVRQFEDGGVATRLATSDRLRRALEAAGAQFIAENGSVCVHYRKHPAEEGAGSEIDEAGAEDNILPQDLNAANDD